MRVLRTRGFEPVDPQFRRAKSAPRLPLHATRTSAGYDFYATEELCIAPGEKAHFPTDLKAYMQPNEMLLLIVRSSMGIREDLMAANTAGIVDSDYYGNPDNDGNLIVFVRNLRPALALSGYKTVTLANGEQLDIPVVEDLREKNTVRIRAGERVVQGIFLPVLPADQGQDAPDRSGGFGSSGK